MLTPAEAKRRLGEVFEPPQAEVLTEVWVEAYGELVKVGDFSELKGLVRELTQAQGRTEKRIEELAQAQGRTEERVGGLEAAMERLAQAQSRTEERVGGLEAAMERLAQAQERTEERMEELAQAQGRTEERMEELAQAQGRLSRQVGGLSDTIGGDLEDIAYIVLHEVLNRELGWQVEPLERVWRKWGEESEEIDIFGRAKDPSRSEQVIWIVGEAKHNLTKREVERFARQVERARSHLEGEVFPVCFCYRARPEVQEQVLAAGIRLVFSYGKLVVPVPRVDAG